MSLGTMVHLEKENLDEKTIEKSRQIFEENHFLINFYETVN